MDGEKLKHVPCSGARLSVACACDRAVEMLAGPSFAEPAVLAILSRYDYYFVGDNCLNGHALQAMLVKMRAMENG